MAIPMDDSLTNRSRERAQRLYKENIEFENRQRKAAQARRPSDPNAWQRMRDNYESIILEDHAFSEQHDIEYALWQLHYKRIEELRAYYSAALASASQNGKGPTQSGPDRITKIRSQFKAFLSEATGFYHDLMVKIMAKYGLSLGFFSDNSENEISVSKDRNKSIDLKKGLISCHRCYIYLGDLARYKGLYGDTDSKAQDFAAASSYYMQASSLLPSSGNPHNQLAILASYSGDELLAVYRYFRSLAVENPFTTARDNLIIAFEKNRLTYSQLPGNSKSTFVKKATVRMTGKGRGRGETRHSLKDRRMEANVAEERAVNTPEIFKAFSIRFVRLNGILFTRTSLETFGDVLSMVRSDLLQLLSSGPDDVFSFGSDAVECTLFIIRLIAIMISTVHSANKETENQSYSEILQRSVVLQNAFTAMFDLMAQFLDRCVKLNDPSSSFLLPGIMIFVEWLACSKNISASSELEDNQAAARSLFWNHSVSFFNKLLSSGDLITEDEDESCFFNMSQYDEGETANRLALPEDVEVRGFLPLLPAQLILDFSRKHCFGDDGVAKEKNARIRRIIAAAKALANLVQDGPHSIYFDSTLKRFVYGVEPKKSEHFTFSTSLEIPPVAGRVKDQEDVSDTRARFGVLQQNSESSGEVEDEDEVIVFKPSANEKHTAEFGLATASYEVSGHGMNPNFTLGNNVSSVPVTYADLYGARTSSPNIAAEFLQSSERNASKSQVEEHDLLGNGLSNLNLFGEVNPQKSELSKLFETLPPPSVPLALPQPYNVGASMSYPSQIPRTAVLSSAAGDGTLAVNPLPTISSALKKPVSRPTRHFGPPPGFNSVTPKQTSEMQSVANLNHENSPTDDYSWLDGYQFQSAYSDTLRSYINQSVLPNNLVDRSISASKGLSFPFPGKQVSTGQVQIENQNVWHDYNFPQYSKLYLEQNQNLKKGYENYVELPQQYQGQSMRESRFIV